MDISDELIDELLKNYSKPEDMLGKGGIFDQLKKRLVERALEAEMSHHVGYDKHERSGSLEDNPRNGKSRKRVKTDNSEFEIEVPRDRNGSFDPQLVKKRQRRLPGFDEKVIAMYARGMSTRDIQAHMEELYGVEVSPDLVSTVTDTVIEEVRQWQNRPLERVYPIVYLDALVLKVRDDGRIRNKAVHVALAINTDGLKEVLGLWIEENEGAKFWLKVLTEIRNRGTSDILIACIDGLSGFEDAIAAVFPQTQVQLCLVHMVRSSTRCVSYKDRKAVVTALKEVYHAPTEVAAEAALEDLAKNWEQRYPTVIRSWKNNWTKIIPCFSYPQEIRRLIYTTNAIESMNYSLRKVLKSRSVFPTDEAVLKLLYLGLRNLAKKWTMPAKEWPLVYNQLGIIFQERFL